MNAEIKPLKGQYYGTIVKLTDGAYKGHEIVIWIATGEYGQFGLDPSIRELEANGVTQKQWDENSQVGNWPLETPDYCEGKPGAAIMAREALGIYDSHFESRVSFEIAQGIVELLKTIKDKR